MIEIKANGNAVKIVLKGIGIEVVGEIVQVVAGIKKLCVERNIMSEGLITKILVNAAAKDPDELIREDGQTNDD
jgi:hypothetical protein